MNEWRGSHVYYVDTQGVATLISRRIQISCIRWVSDSPTVGDDCQIHDGNGNEIWRSRVPGSNFVEESYAFAGDHIWIDGLRVPKLDSGQVYFTIA